jgi:hypothetical protein
MPMRFLRSGEKRIPASVELMKAITQSTCNRWIRENAPGLATYITNRGRKGYYDESLGLAKSFRGFATWREVYISLMGFTTALRKGVVTERKRKNHEPKESRRKIR